MIDQNNSASSKRSPRPVYRKEDNELLGYLLPVAQSDLWLPATVFSYPLGKACSERDAVSLLEDIGLGSLLDRWEFFDSDQEDWFSCTIVEADPDKIKITVSDFGYPDIYQTRTITKPDHTTVRWTKCAR